MIISHNAQGLGDDSSTVDIPFFGGEGGDTSTTSGGFDWSQLWNSLNLGIKNIATPILTSQFGGPKPGQYFAQTPSGNIAYALPTGSTGGFTNPFSTVGGGIGLSGYIPLILIGVLLFGVAKAFGNK